MCSSINCVIQRLPRAGLIDSITKQNSWRSCMMPGCCVVASDKKPPAVRKHPRPLAKPNWRFDMNTNTTSDRLTQLCDQAIARLDRCIQLLKAIRDQDTASANAAAWLRGMTRFIPYEGEQIVVNVDPIFAELEAM